LNYRGSDVVDVVFDNDPCAVFFVKISTIYIRRKAVGGRERKSMYSINKLVVVFCFSY